ncbi:MAG: methionine adenosyltransferase domain-containing protein [Candidatus Pacebacteria bacterium]|nr:methionine adenosyltransferase domain-containing protein [Candidatus Paceibacterota bacterium]
MIQTAEAVSRAHPDKVCDQISDAILDFCLEHDSYSRVAIETLGGHGNIVLTGEITTNAPIEENVYKSIAKQVYKDNGYTDDVDISVYVSGQSNEIKKGVDNEGAGDQGIMVGYATDETPEFMPLEMSLARKLIRSMGRHDGKAQVTVKEGRIINVITSLCESGDLSDVVLNEVFEKEIASYIDGDIKKTWMKNPNGKWRIGGFAADAGLTGRKIVVDAYGPRVAVGGGAFSGKDATKVDRSAAYMARKIAVDHVKAGAKEAVVKIAYAIGHPEPLAATAFVDGREEKVKGYDLRPQAIIEFLDLRKPQFYQTAQYGHFGNGFTWDM